MTDDGSPAPDDRIALLRRDLVALGDHLRDLRIHLLRIYAAVCAVVIVIGALLPAWTEREDGEPVDHRVATIGWQALGTLLDPDRTGDPPSESDLVLGWGFGIGFIGLTITAALLVLSLVVAVIGLSGRRRAVAYRRAVGVLTIIGGGIATLLSLLAATSESGGGGWGPAVLTAGAVAAVALTENVGWHDLWLTDDPR